MQAQIKISVPVSRKTQRDSNGKTDRIMLIREISAAPCADHMINKCTMWG